MESVGWLRANRPEQRGSFFVNGATPVPKQGLVLKLFLIKGLQRFYRTRP